MNCCIVHVDHVDRYTKECQIMSEIDVM